MTNMKLEERLAQCNMCERRICEALLGRRQPTEREKRLITAAVFNRKEDQIIGGKPLTTKERAGLPAIRKAMQCACEMGNTEEVIGRYRQWAVEVCPALTRMLETTNSNGARHMKVGKVIEQAENLDRELPVLQYLAHGGGWVNATGKQVRIGYAVKNQDGGFDVYTKEPKDMRSKPVAILGDGDVLT